MSASNEPRVKDESFIAIAKALADPTRRLILKELRAAGSLTCSCVCNLSSLSQPTISHHIGILEDAGVIRVRKRGQFHELSVNEKSLAAFTGDLAAPRKRRAAARKARP